MGDSRTVNHTIAARLQALSLVEHGVGIDAAATASAMTSITVRRLRKKLENEVLIRRSLLL